MAAAPSLDDTSVEDLRPLTDRDIRELRTYFQEARAGVGGLKGIDYVAKLSAGSVDHSSQDHERITDRHLALAGNARRVERIRDAMVTPGCWHVLSVAYGPEMHDLPAGVPVDIANLLPLTSEAEQWGEETARESEVLIAAERAYAAGRSEGTAPFALVLRVWSAMDREERAQVPAPRIRDAAVAKLAWIAGLAPEKRRARDAERFERAMRQAETRLAYAGDAWVDARQRLGIKHREDDADHSIRQDRDVFRGLAARVRLLKAKAERS